MNTLQSFYKEEIDLLACQSNENLDDLEEFLKDFIGYLREINA